MDGPYMAFLMEDFCEPFRDLEFGIWNLEFGIWNWKSLNGEGEGSVEPTVL